VVKLSVGMIVFNTVSTLPEKMMELCVQSIYPYAHEIILVEGATSASNGHYWDGDTSTFTKDGRSNDGTLDVLRRLESLNKVKVIYGFNYWPGKTTMCNCYSRIANGTHILHLDSDEFYHPEDMEKIIHHLEANPQLSQIDFYANHFWGGWNYCIDEREKGWGNDPPWRRIFKHTPGKSYWLSHEPPVYLNQGLPTYSMQVCNRDETLAMGIKLFHYGYVHYPQIDFKTKFYRNEQYPILWRKFQEDRSTKIFGSNVYPFIGQHPKIIKEAYDLL